MVTPLARSFEANVAIQPATVSSHEICCDGDLSRNVYCVLGLPIDAVDLPTTLRRIREAAEGRSPFLLSTPNLNFLVNSMTDPDFRKSLELSDLCPPDGMPIVWIAKLLGAPIKERASGSDAFEILRGERLPESRLRVFFFGGEKGVGDAVAAKLNAEEGGVRCVGALSSGFGSVEEMSSREIIALINASKAQFLSVSLGAKKGQAWLLHNHASLTVPVRVHLGAVLNFHAGTVRRAPVALRRLGLEWLWRIKEEPHLWRRYFHDGLMLIQLLLTRVLPLAVINAWERIKAGRGQSHLSLEKGESRDTVTIKLSGAALERDVAHAKSHFANVVRRQKSVVVDLSDLSFADSRFLGLLLMLRKQLLANDVDLRFMGIRGRIATILRLNGLAWFASSLDQPHRAAKG